MTRDSTAVRYISRCRWKKACSQCPREGAWAPGGGFQRTRLWQCCQRSLPRHSLPKSMAGNRHAKKKKRCNSTATRDAACEGAVETSIGNLLARVARELASRGCPVGRVAFLASLNRAPVSDGSDNGVEDASAPDLARIDVDMPQYSYGFVSSLATVSY